MKYFLFTVLAGFTLNCFGQNSAGMPSGNIGIGTTTPQIKLHVVGGYIAASTSNSLEGFTQLWDNNSIMWKVGNMNEGLRFGSATDLLAGGYSEKMIIKDNGNLGIGLHDPLAKLHVNGNSILESDLEVKGDFVLGSLFNTVGKGKVLSFDNVSNFDELSIFRYNVASDQSELRVTIGDDGGSADGFIIGVNHYSNGWQPKFRFSADGRLSVGTFDMSPGYRLFVEEGIRTRKVKVDQASWADFVFSPSYKLRPISELKSFINEHHHLPDVPSEKEVVENGQDLGEMNKILLQKIEELTLYAIEQDERIKEQQAFIQGQTKMITNQTGKINQLESLLEKLSSRLSKLEQKQ